MAMIDLALPNLSGGSSGLVVSLGSITETATASGISVPGGGAHSIVASYGGDDNSAASSSATTSLTGSTFESSLSLGITPASATPGQTVTLTASVSPSSNNGYTAGGTVIFSDGGSAIGSPVSVSGGQAVLTKNDFSIGTHDITAVYSGDTNFDGSGAAASSLAIGKQSQTITFAALSPVTYGVSPITVSGSASSELPVGFSLVFGPATISGNGLTITGAGSVVIQADQAGDATYQPATPVLRTLVVDKAGSSAALASSKTRLIYMPRDLNRYRGLADPQNTDRHGPLHGWDHQRGQRCCQRTGSRHLRHHFTGRRYALHHGHVCRGQQFSDLEFNRIVAGDCCARSLHCRKSQRAHHQARPDRNGDSDGHANGPVAFTCTGLPQFASFVHSRELDRQRRQRHSDCAVQIEHRRDDGGCGRPADPRLQLQSNSGPVVSIWHPGSGLSREARETCRAGCGPGGGCKCWC
jgi:Big-like domain-containing protein